MSGTKITLLWGRPREKNVKEKLTKLSANFSFLHRMREPESEKHGYNLTGIISCKEILTLTEKFLESECSNKQF